MLIKRPADIRSSEITDKKLYLNRREFIGATAADHRRGRRGRARREAFVHAAPPAPHGRKLENVKKSPLSAEREAEHVGRDHHLQQLLRVRHRQGLAVDARAQPQDRAVDRRDRRRVREEGQHARSRTSSKGETLEERVYRHRCVEAWSMVIPWVGFPLADLIKQCEPTAKAKFVEFTSLDDPKQMPGCVAVSLAVCRRLRMDEAMHPLTILAVGLYGEVLPNQDGAPLRLVVPWKYGFKSIKSIVQDPLRREAAAEHLAGSGAAGVRLLLQRQPDGRSPALEPGDRTPHRRVPAAQDADVQRLRRSGREPLHRHGPEEELLVGSWDWSWLLRADRPDRLKSS